MTRASGAFQDYYAKTLSQLAVGNQARTIAHSIFRARLNRIPVSPWGYLLAAGLLPAQLRADYGLRWSVGQRTLWWLLRRVVHVMTGPLAPARLRFWDHYYVAVMRCSQVTDPSVTFPDLAEMPVAAFVVNRSRVRDFRRLSRETAAAAAASGWKPVLLETRSADAGGGVTRQAIAAGARLVFAVGGDGTVRACAQALAGGTVPLAIVPRGTANLLATGLGIPSSLGAALAVGFGEHERRIDLAVADGSAFTVMAGIGLDAAVVGATSAALKGTAGWLGYAATGVRRLAGPRTPFAIRLDGGEPMTRQARSVVVGNLGLLPGGFVLLPAARPDDGLLDVGILGPAGLLGWARLGWRVLARSRRDDRVLERYQARRVEITAETQLPRQADGELIGAASSLTVTLAPGGLLVRVPAVPRRGPGRGPGRLSWGYRASTSGPGRASR